MAMGKAILVAIPAMMLAACGDSGSGNNPGANGSPSIIATKAASKAPLALPDLAKCRAENPRTNDDPIRGDPPVIPKRFAGIANADSGNLAFSTLTGKTACVDLDWVSSIEEWEFLWSERFVGLEWSGYEAFGFQLVDRTGEGSVIETGVMPVRSPGGGRIAALQVSEFSFGGLEGFKIWDLTPGGLRERYALMMDADGTLPVIFQQFPDGWRVDGWRSDHCISLSMITVLDLAKVDGEMEQAKRTAYHAAEAYNWNIKPGPCPSL